MVWKCPPLHLPNWNHLWKWKQEMKPHEKLGVAIADAGYTWTPDMRSSWEDLDKQIAKYEQVLQSIANEHIELSHDKIKWQCEDHVRWAKEALK